MTPTPLTYPQRLQALSHFCDVLSAWRVRREIALEHWTLTLPGQDAQNIALEQPWTSTPNDLPALFEFTGTVPGDFSSTDAQLELDLGGEGDVFVYLNGVLCASGGLNPYHRSFKLGTVNGGETLEIRVETVARTFFGAPTQPALARAALTVVERDLEGLLWDMSALIEAARELAEHEVVPQLLGVAEEALELLEWPSNTLEVLGRGGAVLGAGYAAGVWRLPPFPGPQPLSPSARASILSARAHLQAELEQLVTLYPPIGRLALTGHAHIDLGWLWPVHETRRKIRRTFRTVVALMREYPHFTFNQSSAQAYTWLEADDPELFAQVKTLVLGGRIEAVGGSWVEPDGQMPSGESWARHFLYGQRYFQLTFGRRSSVLWLPDTFGYAPALPQILKLSGITGFFTTKISWNETNRFPHDLFAWEGLDGTRITAHMFHNPGSGGYNGEIRAQDTVGTWRNSRAKSLRIWGQSPPKSLLSYGWGDGGGGPTREHLEGFERLKVFPALPRLEHTRVDDFFASLPPTRNLPVWVGELYLELHRATLTTQGRVKKLNREAEHRLVEAEVLSSIAWLSGKVYPQKRLETAWKTLLLNQFHDILPGSSIAEVYQSAIPELEGVVNEAQAVTREAVSSGEPQVYTVFNPALEARPLRALLPDSSFVASGVRSQPTSGGTLVYSRTPVPALGGILLEQGAKGALESDPQQPDSPQPDSIARLEGENYLLENGLLSVRIAPDGTLAALTDLEHSREVLSGPGNLLTAYPDLPRAWEAWDTQTQLGSAGEALLEVGSIEILETGPLRASVRVTRKWRSSTVVQTYRLSIGSSRLDIETTLDWRERRTFLRALFPLNVHADTARFETAFGAVSRPTHRNTSWDAARFEVCGHRWADLSEPGYGVALLNDGKYGHSSLGGTLALSLVRGAMFPDLTADEGAQHFTYALYPHLGDAQAGQVALEALDLNSPLLLLPGTLQNPLEGLCCTGLKVTLSSLKKAEDSDALILRIYEPYGARGVVTLEIPGLRAASKVNLLEDPLESLTLEGIKLVLEVWPFEIISLRLEF